MADCCRAYAAVGEMAGAFQDLFGEWDEPCIFQRAFDSAGSGLTRVPANARNRVPILYV